MRFKWNSLLKRLSIWKIWLDPNKLRVYLMNYCKQYCYHYGYVPDTYYQIKDPGGYFLQSLEECCEEFWISYKNENI